MFKVESVGGAIAGIFLLVLAYLVISQGDKTVQIIGAIGSNAIKGIKTLQARD